MRPAVPPTDRGGGYATTALLAFASAALGLLSALPLFLGPVVGGLGVALAWLARRRLSAARRPLALSPALGGLTVLTVTSPAAPSTELFAGFTTLAFLLWVADDPARPSGGGRRAVPTIALAGVAVGFTWLLSRLWTGPAVPIALTGGVVAGALVLLAVLYARPASSGPVAVDGG